MKYPPNCNVKPPADKFCEGYKKEKIKIKDGCPCKD